MATTPRRKSNRTTSSARAKKPTTIDLDAVEVKDDSKLVESDRKTTPKPTETTGRAKQTRSSTVKSVPKTTTKTEDTSAEPAVEIKPVQASENRENVVEKPDNPGGGFGRLVAAGLIGSAITLGGAGYMQYAGYLPSMNVNNVDNGTPVAVSVPDLAPLQTKIAELEAKFNSQPITENPIVDLSPLETRLSNVEDSLVKSLNALSLAETSLANLSTSSDSDISLQLAQEMTKIKADLNKLEFSGRQLAIKISTLPETNTSGTLTNENVSEIVTPLISPLAKAGDNNKQEISELKKEIAAITGRIDKELVSRIEQINIKLKNAATGERLAKSVAINALKSALENGEPYSAALASVETITGASAPLEQLRSSASSGIATTKYLLNEFHGLQNKILLTANSDGNASLSDRVMVSIKSLVTISSDKPLSGNTPEAIISRIDAGLKSGKLNEALVEWNSLPEPAQSISQSWADELKRRNNADQQMLELMKSIQSSSNSG